MQVSKERTTNQILIDVAGRLYPDEHAVSSAPLIEKFAKAVGLKLFPEMTIEGKAFDTIAQGWRRRVIQAFGTGLIIGLHRKDCDFESKKAAVNCEEHDLIKTLVQKTIDHMQDEYDLDRPRAEEDFEDATMHARADFPELENESGGEALLCAIAAGYCLRHHSKVVEMARQNKLIPKRVI